MSNDFQAVIIGSGFGGSVMAYQLADAGLRVCLLERGKKYPPNSFPRAPFKMKKNFWDPSAGLYGLFSIWSFRGLGAVVSSGLGGGSLIYANVLLRKDEKWFVKEDLNKGGYEYWPVTRSQLDPHYDQVEKMMNAQPYPFNHPPYDQTPKTRAMQEAAAQLGLEWELPNLAVSFRSKPYDPSNPNDPNNLPRTGEPVFEATGHENLHGKGRDTCRLCGECDIGCNYGSKNTLDFNYLSEAQHRGAQIKELCEVRSFEPRGPGKGFSVSYVQHDLSLEGVPTDTGKLQLVTITCDRLILSAGTFGSPYLLFKNRSAFPKISKKLGSRFSINGDYLSFFLKSRQIVGGEEIPRILDPSYGPVITSAIRVGDALDTGGPGDLKQRGFYVEDGGYPEFFNWLIETAQFPGFVGRLMKFGQRYLWGLFGWDPNHDLDSAFSALIGPTDLSMSSLPLLTMGRDIPDGNMKLKGKYLDVDWTMKASEQYFERVRDVLHKLAAAMEATYQDNLSWYLSQVLTAHPLGGCPMGTSEADGVVDANGQVFNYPGLYVADGSVLPGPTGANPSLTIGALSNLFAEQIIASAK
jgi:cholesterol oxidase